MRKRARILPEAEQDRNDRVRRAGQRRAAVGAIERIEIGAARKRIYARINARKRSEVGLDEGRRAAGFVFLRIVADQAEADIFGRFEQHLRADQIAVAIVDVGVVGHIVVKAVTLEIHAVDTRRHRFAERGIDAPFDLDRIVIAIGESAVAGEFEFGRGGVDVDQACGGVAPAQRTLRAAQDFHPIDRAEFGQGIARTRTIYAIDEDRDRAFEARIVADRSDTADTRRAIGFVAGRGDEQGRGNLIEVANIGNTGFLQQFARNGRHSYRYVGQCLFAALGAHDDDIAVIDIRGIDKTGFLIGFRLVLRLRRNGHEGQRPCQCSQRTLMT